MNRTEAMTHLEIENLVSEYLEGQLDAVRLAGVEQHLGGCAFCRELVADVRHAFELCRAAEPVEPAPWLVPKILRATLGERKPGLMERITAWFRPRVQVRTVYTAAMTVFSLSVIANACGINLRHLKLEESESPNVGVPSRPQRTSAAGPCGEILLRPEGGLRDRITLAAAARPALC